MRKIVNVELILVTVGRSQLTLTTSRVTKESLHIESMIGP